MDWIRDVVQWVGMSRLELGFWSFPILLGLIFLRAPIGLAMFLCGLLGWVFAMNGNPTPILAKLKSETYTTFSNYSLTIIPLFLLMGQFATLSGMSSALFKAAESFLGHRKGGVAMAAVGACAGFGAICGSSLATAATPVGSWTAAGGTVALSLSEAIRPMAAPPARPRSAMTAAMTNGAFDPGAFASDAMSAAISKRGSDVDALTGRAGPVWSGRVTIPLEISVGSPSIST